ncbi:MAG: hypothetical protein H0U74_07275 [Bradymonadaceae bacterium]|nr:hypothetical protein [Lujinxingiaceae bacterium]
MSQDTLGAKSTTIQNTRFLKESAGRADDVLTRKVGPKLCGHLIKLIKVSSMFSLDHQQTSSAALEFTEWLDEQLKEQNEEQFCLQISENSFLINGQLIKFDERAYERANVLRRQFGKLAVNQLTLMRGLAAGEIRSLIESFQRAGGDQGVPEGEGIRQPHLELTQAKVQESINAVARIDERRQLVEMYAGLLVKVSTYFQQLTGTSVPSARFVKRFVQRIAEVLPRHGNFFVGLVNLQLVAGKNFVHAANTSIYAMLLANEIGLMRSDIVRVGMTAITQDIHRLRTEFTEPEGMTVGDTQHFESNLEAVITLSELGSSDVLSALRLVTAYERGFPYNRTLPTVWYRDELKPHLLSRLIELARHYDVLTQGIDGVKAMSPDMALERLLSQIGSHYDADLTRVFVNLIGLFPVGVTVQLSSGEQALVIRTPSADSRKMMVANLNRPVVRLLDGSARIIDLSAPEHRGLRVARIVDKAQIQETPSAFFLF